MAETTKEILEKWADEQIEALIQQYDRLGLRASGKFEKELRSVIEDKVNGYITRIYAPRYTGALMEGRKPTDPSKRGRLRFIIEKWIDDKGIKPHGKISKKSLAFLIARKIDEQGIKVPNQYNPGTLTDVISTKILAERLHSAEIVSIKSNILKNLKTWQSVQ